MDTSDHEVNIKILLSSEMAAGRPSRHDRDAFLASMTDAEVADLVLAHNYDQNLAMANSVYQSASMAGVHEDWMERFPHSGPTGTLEALPSTEEMDIRRSKNRGLNIT